MYTHIENINATNFQPVVQTDAHGAITPVDIYIQDLTVRSRHRRYSDTNSYVLHTSASSYNGSRAGVIDFLNAESTEYKERPFYISIPETQTRVNMATELADLLHDCFSYMTPKSEAVREFVDNFSNRLLDYAVDNYTTIVGENGEDPLADLHNTLQPMWSGAITSPWATTEYIINPEPSVDNCTPTYVIYKNTNGVWVVFTDRDLKLRPQLSSTLHDDSDILVVTVQTTNETVNPWLPKPMGAIKDFHINRYVR